MIADWISVSQVLQQFVSSRQTLDLSQLLKVRGHLVCSQQSDAAAFCLSWSAICPSISVDVQPVRAIPIIPTALLRSLTNINRPLHPSSTQQRGWERVTFSTRRQDPSNGARSGFNCCLFFQVSDHGPDQEAAPVAGVWSQGLHPATGRAVSQIFSVLFH